MDITIYIEELCAKAKDAARSVSSADTSKKNYALVTLADKLRGHVPEILAANDADMGAAEQNGVPKVMLDRLKLTEKRVESMAESLIDISKLPDPVGNGETTLRPNGMRVTNVRVPLGVIAVIYEARPNVTIDAAALCVKSGNAVVLRGGKEAINTNRELIKHIKEALITAGLKPDAVGFVDDTSREGSEVLMNMRRYIDVLIPRGGEGLIKTVVENSRIPVLETGVGNCHVYIDEHADLTMAINIAVNAKVSRPSVCNAVETVLVHSSVARDFLTRFSDAVEPWHVEMRGCPRTREILPGISQAAESDYYTEFNDFICAVKVVDSLDEAVAHINKYNSRHSEAIVTDNLACAETFLTTVDAAAVYVNASTRFTDGGEFGMGAEIGISTQNLHVRGPVGLRELTTNKFLIVGNGQVRL